jgi:flagellar basal body-associated protein FliL
MEQKKKVLALLVSVGLLAGGGIGYIWFSEKGISQEVAQKIEEQPENQPAAKSGAVIDTREEIAYVADIEGIVKINRN